MRFWLIFASFLIAVGLGFYQLIQSPDEPLGTHDDSERPTILTSIELKSYQGSELKFRLFAQKAQVLESTKMMDLVDIYGIFSATTPKGEPTKIWANQANVKGQDKLVTLLGDVRVEFPQGKVLVTQYLVYDQTQDLLWGDQPVRLFGLVDSVKAKGMKYLIPKEHLTLIRPLVELKL